MNRLPYRDVCRALAPLASAFALLSCGVGESPVASSADEEGRSRLVVPMPRAIAQTRAIDPATLSVRASMDGDPITPVRRANVWTLETVVPPGQAAVVTIEWFATYFVDELPVAFLSRPIGPFDRDASLEIDPDDYESGAEFDGGRLDRDGDGRSNLAELDAGTDPTDPSDPSGTESAPSGDPVPEPAPGPEPEPTPDPGSAPTAPFARAPVVVPYVGPGTPPEIDGFNESPQWNAATFGDSAGQALSIDRLVIERDGAAEAADGESGYRWAAMHDGTFLYLYVQFEDARRTPVADTPDRWYEDDALNLFFDGDLSRGAELEGVDGGDDRYVVIPQLERPGEDTVRAFAPFGGRAPVYPPSLEFGICLECPGRASGWEVKVAIEELGIAVSEPFGFEVQIDQDLDGGPREARWAWANPSIAQREEAVFESPALNGTVTLAPPE